MKHQQTVFNKSCSFAYNLLMKCVSCFIKTIYATCFDSLNNNHDKKNDDEKSVLYAFITAMLTAVSCTNDIPANVTGDTSGNTSEDTSEGTSGSGSGDLSGNSGKISIVASVASQTRTPQLGSDGSGS